MALDPRLLRSFVGLAEELHFSRAAERLSLSQPALSQQIRRLEGQLGAELYTRSTRNVELTDAGRAMLDPARDALRAVAQAERAAQDAARTRVHQLRVGVEITLEDVVPAVMAYAQEHTDVALWLSRLHEPHGHEALAAAHIDAFIGLLPPSDTDDAPRTRTIDVVLSAVVRRDHPLAHRPSVSLDAFRQSPIAIFGRDQSPPLFDGFVDVLSQGAGRTALSLLELDATGTCSQAAMLAQAETGNAVSFGTSATLAPGAHHLQALPFDPPLSVPAYLSWRTRSTAVGGLVAELRREP